MVVKDALKKKVAEQLKTLDDAAADDFALLKILENGQVAKLYLIFFDLSVRGITNVDRELLIKKMTSYRQNIMNWSLKLKPFKIFLIRQTKNQYYKFIIKPEEFFEEKFVNKALDTINKEEDDDD